MADFKKFPIVAETANQYATEVLVLADAVGNAPVTLVEVMQDFLKFVKDPIVAGGFAVAHHGFVRGTVDVDVIAIKSVAADIETLKALGYKHESIQIPIGHLDLLTKNNKGIVFIHLADDEFLKSIESRAVKGQILNSDVRMVSLEDLILLKSLSLKGRQSRKDPIDLDYLLELTHDATYVAKWKKHFGLT